MNGSPERGPTPERIPLWVLLTVAVLMGAVFIAALMARMHEFDASRMPPSEIVQQTALRFDDAPGGRVLIWRLDDAGEPALVRELGPGEETGIRGILRAFGWERRLQDNDPGAPFLLFRQADGRLLLEDTTTGQRIDLAAYGETSMRAFATLLPATAGSAPERSGTAGIGTDGN